MINLVFFISFTLGFLLGLLVRSLYKIIRQKRPFRLKKYDNEYKSFLEFDGSF